MIAPVKLIADDFLTKEERNSPVWQSVRGHLERMLAKKRIENDSSELTDVETATLRGHIGFLKAMLALGKEPPATAATAAQPGLRRDYGAQNG